MDETTNNLPVFEVRTTVRRRDRNPDGSWGEEYQEAVVGLVTVSREVAALVQKAAWNKNREAKDGALRAKIIKAERVQG